jgi:hypothetical protein
MLFYNTLIVNKTGLQLETQQNDAFKSRGRAGCVCSDMHVYWCGSKGSTIILNGILAI